VNSVGHTFATLFAGLIIGFMASKYAHRVGFETGLEYTAKKTDQVCTAWWFNNSASRLKDAKKFMCQGKQ
jgi:hypothetical protein